MAELNDEQTRELNRAVKLLVFCDIDYNTAIWGGYVPFKKAVDLLRADVDKINELVPVKEKSGTSVTLNKDDLKKSFSFITGGLFSIARQYALAFGDTTLAGQVKKSETEILRIKDTEILGFGTSLSSEIFTTTLLANTDFMDYGITLTKVNTAIAMSVKFNDTIGVSSAITVVSDTANVDIMNLVTEMRNCVGTMLGLKSNFLPANESFVTGLEKAAVRDDIGVRHTGAHATITLDGVGIKGGKFTIGKKTYESMDSGNCKPMYVTHGNKNITVELDGFADKKSVFYFIKGEVNAMNFDFVTPVAVG